MSGHVLRRRLALRRSQFRPPVMPGKHSPQRLLARRARARERGYLVPRNPGVQHVAVATSVAPRVKVLAESLRIQEVHNAMANSPSAVARLATRSVKERLRPDEYKYSMATHDAANGAKHNWERGAVRPACPPPPPRCVDAEVQTDQPVLSPDAPVFYPSLVDPSPLIDTQNATIAVLTGRLEECAPAQRRIRDLERRAVTMQKDIQNLAASLSATVDRKAQECFEAKWKSQYELNQADMAAIVDSRMRAIGLPTIDMIGSMVSEVCSKELKSWNADLDAVLAAALDAASHKMQSALQKYVDGRFAAHLLPPPERGVRAPPSPPPPCGDVEQVARPLARVCHRCGASTEKLLRCARCHHAQYCSAACQRKAWPDHKLQCQAPSASSASAACSPSSPVVPAEPGADWLHDMSEQAGPHDVDGMQVLLDCIAKDVSCSTPPSSGASSPAGEFTASRAYSSTARRGGFNRTLSTRPSEAELDRQVASVRWSG